MAELQFEYKRKSLVKILERHLLLKNLLLTNPAIKGYIELLADVHRLEFTSIKATSVNSDEAGTADDEEVTIHLAPRAEQGAEKLQIVQKMTALLEQG